MMNTSKRPLMCMLLIAVFLPTYGNNQNTRCCLAPGCFWAGWRSWGSCKAPFCDTQGTKARYRSVTSLCVGSTPWPCTGNARSRSFCTKQCSPSISGKCCALPSCQWAGWISSGTCDAHGSCGTGSLLRTRGVTAGCVGRYPFPCHGDRNQTEPCEVPCQLQCTPECQWTAWNPWSICGVSCGTGEQRRSRGVSNGCYGEINQVPCAGSHIRTKTCNKICTPTATCGPTGCIWTAWDPWSRCPAQCGMMASQTRFRRVTPQCGSLQPCNDDQIESRICRGLCCNTQADCYWTPWTSFTGCTKTCEDRGIQTRQRNFSPTCGLLKPCTGTDQEQKPCNSKRCCIITAFTQQNINTPNGCAWSDWLSWEQCSATCGARGIRIRTRKVTAQCGNLIPCESRQNEIGSCIGPCCSQQADCNWNKWSDYTGCSRTCEEVGIQTRIRSFSSGCRGIKPCSGSEKQQIPCNTNRCCATSIFTNQNGIQRIGCTWSRWNPWPNCLAPCGTTVAQSRTRSTTPQCLGLLPCDGGPTQTRTCTGSCCASFPICFWTNWSPWNSCPGECDAVAIQIRNRHKRISCGNLEPCEGGPTMQSKLCRGTCICSNNLNCVYLSWGDWGPCSAPCGNSGTRVRTRTYSIACGNLPPCPVRSLQQTAFCTSGCLPWSSWRPCNCFTQSRWRTRVCDSHCSSETAVERQPCSCQGCCSWGGWNSWSPSPCTGCGQQIRRMLDGDCTNPFLTQCSTKEPDQSRRCPNCNECTPCLWGRWTNWSPSPCNLTPCQPQTRRRRNGQCAGVNPPPCTPKEPDESRICPNCNECTPCLWGRWRNWSPTPCNLTPCQPQTRRRRNGQCAGVNPPPCTPKDPEESRECENCNQCDSSPSCQWADWQSGPCNNTNCVSGFEQRTRSATGCSPPFPKPCGGEDKESETIPCCDCPTTDDGCHWGPWFPFSLWEGTCTCNDDANEDDAINTRRRYRDSVNCPVPEPCRGESTQIDDQCPEQYCFSKNCDTFDHHDGFCYTSPPVPGLPCVWEPWLVIPCDAATCGDEGVIRRERVGSSGCDGPDCKPVPCDGWVELSQLVNDGRAKEVHNIMCTSTTSCPGCDSTNCLWVASFGWTGCSGACSRLGVRTRYYLASDSCNGNSPVPCAAPPINEQGIETIPCVGTCHPVWPVGCVWPAVFVSNPSTSDCQASCDVPNPTCPLTVAPPAGCFCPPNMLQKADGGCVALSSEC